MVLFHEIDLAIVHEIQSDRDFYRNTPARTRTQSRFDEISSHVGKFHLKVLGHQPSQSHRLHTIDIDSLVDTRYNDVWKLAAEALLVSQGIERAGVTYNVTKNRARLILSLRSKILDFIEPIEDELLEQRLGYLLSAMKSRLRSLDGFEAVYDRNVGTRGQFKDEPPYTSPSKRLGRGHSASGAYQQNQQNVSISHNLRAWLTSNASETPP